MMNGIKPKRNPLPFSPEAYQQRRKASANSILSDPRMNTPAEKKQPLFTVKEKALIVIIFLLAITTGYALRSNHQTQQHLCELGTLISANEKGSTFAHAVDVACSY